MTLLYTCIFTKFNTFCNNNITPYSDVAISPKTRYKFCIKHAMSKWRVVQYLYLHVTDRCLIKLRLQCRLTRLGSVYGYKLNAAFFRTSTLRTWAFCSDVLPFAAWLQHCPWSCQRTTTDARPQRHRAACDREYAIKTMWPLEYRQLWIILYYIVCLMTYFL